MKAAASFATTVAMAVVAGLLAWVAWEYSRPLLAEILPQPFRGFILEMRFVVSFIAVIAALSFVERLVSWIGRKFDPDE